MEGNERLTGEELASIRRRVERLSKGNVLRDRSNLIVNNKVVFEDVPKLLAEIERLQEANTTLSNFCVKLVVHDIEMMDTYIPGWREYAVKELSALRELIAND